MGDAQPHSISPEVLFVGGLRIAAQTFPTPWATTAVSCTRTACTSSAVR